MDCRNNGNLNMSRIPLAMSPGIYRNGTDYQAKGRWFDCNLVRFYNRTIQPYGGWQVLSNSPMAGVARCAITWKDNSGTARACIGTNTNLYAMTRTGGIFDITPSVFISGRANAVAAGGFGSGPFGSGGFGSPRPGIGITEDASVWSIDTWGEDINAVMADDGTIYQWSLDPAVRAVAIANAPTARALLVTGQRILMALGAEGNPRRVKWSDQENNTLWAPDATNQAGDFDLQTNGRLMLGKKIKGGAILLTDIDAHLATYTADTLVYSFGDGPIATGCGAISQNCAAVFDNSIFWMSKSGFWKYNGGFVQQIPCDVLDFVYSDIDMDQSSKTTCEADSTFGEVTWRYQSLSTTTGDVDKYVTLETTGDFHIGSMSRLVGVDAGALRNHIAVTLDGYIYEHEVGFDYGGAIPFIEGGPLELGNGDNSYDVIGYIPDERTLGDVVISFIAKYEPEDSPETYGPYTASARTDLRFSGRQVNIRFDGARNTDWRIGIPRLMIEQAGTRG